MVAKQGMGADGHLLPVQQAADVRGNVVGVHHNLEDLVACRDLAAQPRSPREARTAYNHRANLHPYIIVSVLEDSILKSIIIT